MNKNVKKNIAKVIFFPYAGASAYSYATWKKYFPDDIELCFLELAGRGARMKEPFYKNVKEAVDDVFSILKKEVQDSNYYIFGHSMGSLIAFELFYKIEEENFKLPNHIFFSGRNPPDLCKSLKKISHLNDLEFLNEVKKYGGILEEIYSDDELRDIFIPILRADFKLLEDYEYIKHNSQINCNITALYGKNDMSTSREKIRKWKNHAGKDFTLVQFLGEHFFCLQPNECRRIIKRIVDIHKYESEFIGGQI